MNFYIYRFSDASKNILYIGRTNDLERRILGEHLSVSGHLPVECYSRIEGIEFIQLNTEIEQVIYEALLINCLKPEFNKQFAENIVLNINVPKFNWTSVSFIDNSKLQTLKERKSYYCIFTDLINNSQKFSENMTIISGIPEIDSKAPLYRGELILIATSLGSTHKDLARMMSCNVARGEEKKAIYIEMKDSLNLISVKMISQETGVPFESIVNNTMTDEDHKKISDSVLTVKKLNFRMLGSDMQFDSVKIIELVEKERPDIIVVNSLEDLIAGQNEYNRDKSLKDLVLLKIAANKFNCLVIVTYSLSAKLGMHRQDHRPVLSDLDFESMISVPDKIIFTHEFDLFDGNLNEDTKGILDVIILKNNNGMVMYDKLTYLKSCFRVTGIK